MCPHTDNFDGLNVVENLADETMLSIDSSEPRSRIITQELLIGLWRLVGIFGQDLEKLCALGLSPDRETFFASLWPDGCRQASNSPIEFRVALVNRRLYSLDYRFTQDGGRREIQRLLDGSPVLSRHENSGVAFACNLNRFM